MDPSRRSRLNGRSLALLVAGMLAGSVLIAPAVARVSRDAKPLTQKKADKRYVFIMRAERNGSGSFTDEATDQTVSSVEITTTTSGLLVVHGSVHVNSNSVVSRAFELYYTIPGVSGPKEGGGEAFAGPDLVGGVADPAEGVQIAYVDVFPVDKGTFTVDQLLGPGIATDMASWSFSRETLVVEFFPESGAALG